jgi:hypothetical protein
MKSRFSSKFRPKCGSIDVFWAQGLPQLLSLWQVRTVATTGVILENGNLVEKLQEEWKNKASCSLMG